MSQLSLPRNSLIPRPAGGPPVTWQPPKEPLILDAPRPRTGWPVMLGYAIVLVFILGFGGWADLAAYE